MLLKKISISLLLIIYSFIILSHPAVAVENDLDLAICLKNKGYVMYGSDNCGACMLQKQYFGDSFKEINFVNCPARGDFCSKKGITAFPSWEDNKGKIYKGALSLTSLAEISGCNYAPSTIDNKNNSETNGLVAAFLAGLASFLAPCLLPLLPAYFSVITGFTLADLYGLNFNKLRSRVFLSALFFIFGFTIVFTILGATASVAGRLLNRYLLYILPFNGLLLILLGLIQTGVLKFHSLQFDYAWRVQKKLQNLGFITALVTGLASAFSWIPCIGALLSPFLLLASAQATLYKGMLLLFFYSLGITFPFAIAALFFPQIIKFIQNNRNILHLVSLAAGIIMIGFGFILLIGRYNNFINIINNLIKI